MRGASWVLSMRGAGSSLLGFGLAAVTLLAMVHQCTAPRIAAEERAARRAALLQILPSQSFDNDILADRIRWELPPAWSATGPDLIWRARKQGRVVAFILPVRATQGYSGPIDYLLAAAPTGKVLGLRVVAHRETPGLGDGIEDQRSDWPQQFQSQELHVVGVAAWRIRKDGGVFDQLSGATVTTRTVVDSMREALVFLQQHAQQLSAEPALETADE